MFDELFKLDDDKDEEKDEPKGDPESAYEEGRTDDSPNIFHTDTDSEAEARERGNEDRINAEETKKENEKDDE